LDLILAVVVKTIGQPSALLRQHNHVVTGSVLSKNGTERFEDGGRKTFTVINNDRSLLLMVVNGEVTVSENKLMVKSDISVGGKVTTPLIDSFSGPLTLRAATGEVAILQRLRLVGNGFSIILMEI
jgi:hypothetical protein